MPSTKRRPVSWIGAQSSSPKRRLKATSPASSSVWSRMRITEWSSHARVIRENQASSSLGSAYLGTERCAGGHDFDVSLVEGAVELSFRTDRHVGLRYHVRCGSCRGE